MISREEVQHLATLARLELSDKEIESLQKDKSGILEYVGQVSAVAGAGEGGKKPMPKLHNVMREDALREENDPLAGKEKSLREAFPKEKDGFNVVRKIIQKDE